jgi:hypothetical protein
MGLRTIVCIVSVIIALCIVLFAVRSNRDVDDNACMSICSETESSDSLSPAGEYNLYNEIATFMDKQDEYVMN